MVTLTIIFGITALVAAHYAGITSTWLGTGSATALVTVMAIAVVPECHILFDSLVGGLSLILLWAVYTTFIHVRLAALRRPTPINADPRRAAIDCRWGGRRVAIAIVWGGA